MNRRRYAITTKQTEVKVIPNDLALRLVNQDVDLALDAAKRGSLNALHDIAMAVPFVRHHHHIVSSVRMFCQILDTSAGTGRKTDDASVPEDISDLTKKRSALALIALSNLNYFYLDLPEIEPIIIQSWPSIQRWILFHFKEDVLNPPADRHPLAHQELSGPLGGVFNSVSTNTALFKRLISRHPLIPRIIYRLWLAEDMFASPKIIEEDFKIPRSSLPLQKLFHSYPAGEIIGGLIKEANGDSMLVADTILKRFRSALKMQPLYPTAMWILSTTLGYMTGDKKHAFTSAVLERGGMVIITKCLFALTKILRHKANEEASRSICDFLKIMHSFQNNQYYGSAMVRATRAGILEAVYECKRYKASFDSGGVDIIDDFFESYAYRLLMFYPILSPLAVAMDRLAKRPRILDKKLEIFWPMCLEHLVYKCIYDYTEERRQRSMCDNCQNLEHYKLLRECAGCRMTQYCSKSCQAAAWKCTTLEHRINCKIAQSYNSSRTFVDSRRNSTFLRKVATIDARKHLVGLKRLYRENFGDDADLDDMVISMSYKRFGPDLFLDVTPKKALDSTIDPFVLRRRQTVAEYTRLLSSSDKCTSITVSVHLDEGGMSFEVPMAPIKKLREDEQKGPKPRSRRVGTALKQYAGDNRMFHRYDLKAEWDEVDEVMQRVSEMHTTEQETFGNAPPLKSTGKTIKKVIKGMDEEYSAQGIDVFEAWA